MAEKQNLIQRDENPVVSVIVPCYNQAKYLPDALDSVIAQTYPNWECIIINDGSPDNTEEIASRYVKKDPRIHYIYQNNQGVASARNNAIRHSCGKYILPLDADDMIDKTYLEKALECFMNDSNLTVVYTEVMRFGMMSGLWHLPEYNWETIIWGNVIPVTALFLRADYDRTCGYNSNMIYGYEDWDFWLSMLSPEACVCKIKEPLCYYRAKQYSRSDENDKTDNWLQSHRQIFLNHPEIYSKHTQDIIVYHNKSLELNHIKKSKSYHLGERIARIYRFFRYRG